MSIYDDPSVIPFVPQYAQARGGGGASIPLGEGDFGETPALPLGELDFGNTIGGGDVGSAAAAAQLAFGHLFDEPAPAAHSDDPEIDALLQPTGPGDVVYT